MHAVYYDRFFWEHDTGPHPENAGRLRALETLPWVAAAAAAAQRTWQPASTEALSAVHTAEHIRAIEQFASQGGGAIEADTTLSRQSFQVARLAAGAVVDATERVLSGELRTALCLVRPPGHHALSDQPMGFCLFNNVAVAAKLAHTQRGLDRILIVDWDVHHGNGTQAIFWRDPAVGFFSMHRYPFYPGTGAAIETGEGPGLGMTRNLPVAYGTSRQEILASFSSELQTFADRLRPQLVLISAGFDAHRLDPIGSLGLESEDFTALTQTVRQIAQTHCQGKLVSVLEGGYHPAALAESVDLHWQALTSD